MKAIVSNLKSNMDRFIAIAIKLPLELKSI